MKKLSILLTLSIFTVFSCTHDNFLLPDPTTKDINGKVSINNDANPNPDAPEVLDFIDDELLKSGAKIFVNISKTNQVTANFEFPTPNTEDQVTWWYQWQYIPVKGEGVKTSYDKTLKFNASTDSYLLLYVQCTTMKGVKSDIILSGTKIILNGKQKKVHQDY